MSVRVDDGEAEADDVVSRERECEWVRVEPR